MNRLFSEEEIYEKFRPYVSKGKLFEIIEGMTETKAVIIPDNATNESVLETVFGIEEKQEVCNDCIALTLAGGTGTAFKKAWYNAPYEIQTKK